jgi:type IV secretion system protein VirB4
MFKFNRRERLLTEYVQLFDHVDDQVVLLRDGSTFAMVQVEGLPAQTLDEDIMRRARRMLNHTYVGLSSHDGLVLYQWVCRGIVADGIYPTGRFASPVAERIDAKYRSRLLERNLYLNRTYVGLLIRPPQLAGEFVGDQLTKASAPRDVEDEPPEQRIDRLHQVLGIVARDMADYHPRILGLRENGRGQIFSEVAEALIFAMTGVWRSVGLQSGGRIGMLFSERIIVGRESIEIRGPGTSAWAACFGAKHMPRLCPPGTLGGFLSAPFRCTVAQSFRFINRMDAERLMSRTQNRMVSVGDPAADQINLLNRARQEVMNGALAMGDHGLVTTVFADDLKALRQVTNDAWHILQNNGMQVAREDDALEAAYFSMLPGNARWRPRPGVISSSNYAGLGSMHAYPAGDETGPWGDPLAIFRTTGGTPYRFHPHVGGVANAFVFGASGSGKSTWLAWLIIQASRLGIQIVLWDKDRGLEIVSRAVGGRYLPMRRPTGLSWLKAYQDTEEDRQALAALIRGLIASRDGYVMTPEEDRRLHLGLQAIMSLPSEERWMGDLRAFLGVSSDGAGVRLEPWCVGGEYGWVGDNPADEVRLDASVIGFDVTQFLTDPLVAGPVMTDLLYRTNQLADGRPILYIIDEGWRVVNIPAFADAAADHLKTDRKKNAGIIFATQSPRDGLRSKIGYTIREQCPTIIGFAIDRPDRDDLRELRYSDRECQIIEELRDHMFLLRQGDRSAVLQLPLHGMHDEIAVLSGNTVNVGILDEVRTELPEDIDPEDLIDAFVARRTARAARPRPRSSMEFAR